MATPSSELTSRLSASSCLSAAWGFFVPSSRKRRSRSSAARFDHATAIRPCARCAASAFAHSPARRCSAPCRGALPRPAAAGIPDTPHSRVSA
ncbi:hypothetical protein N791_13760 [Lysobacter defluvii IMMIB APB-9 = DSM 18482]|uniref:Uncharacterized protein n=1 Tax=Lysobacter defluvii IMMIB APB-9 = DSM 18482 TaxID=1385515 RepID=A0A0A0M9M6_9GAMM|nr:hypothetical protein N791_13760 [Lysobacter defluvii IMMIB APB-9 = DSM 18482]